MINLTKDLLMFFADNYDQNFPNSEMQAIHSLGPLLCIKPGVETPASMIDPETQEPSINPQEGTSESGQRRTQMTTGVTESLGTSETVAPRQRRTQITVPRMEMHDYLPQRYNIIDIFDVNFRF